MVTSVNINTTAGTDIYALPFDFNIKGTVSNQYLTDFYSITQLRVAYEEDKNGNPIFRVCKPISLTDYNISPSGRSIGEPLIWRRISKRNPRYVFINKYEDGAIQTHIRIFPTPEKRIIG